MKNDYELSELIRLKVAAELKRRGVDPSSVTAADTMNTSDDRAAEEIQHSKSTVMPKDEREVRGGDDFWDLGSPSPKTYEKPSFTKEALSVTDVRDDAVTDTSVNDSSVNDSSTADSSANDIKSAGGEKIPQRTQYPSQTMNPFTSLPPKYVTRSYKRPTQHARQSVNSEPSKTEIQKSESEKPVVYEKNGALISKITVDCWSGENNFYTRFALDAERSHTAAPRTSPDTPMVPAQFFSLVPQYSHMSGKQTEYYRRLRDKWRAGEYPECDSAYIMLYIFELLNLTSVTNEYVLSALSSIWIGYRERMARLDSYLCEWTADYCMINDLPLPDAMRPYISAISANSHFKEYYFDYLLSHGEFDDAAHALIYCFSDYVYSSSKYYGENSVQYEKYIPSAVSAVLKEGLERGFGIFACEKKYKIVIDTFLGCAISSAKKKKLTVEFRSFLRGIETREYVTALVKYSENMLRKCLGIKAKLGVKELDSDTISIVNAFFTPMLPEEKIHLSPEEKYMPRDYLKNYEAETSGFDPEAAAEIERASWANTVRLTADEDNDVAQNRTSDEIRSSPDELQPFADYVDGEISSGDLSHGDISASDIVSDESTADGIVKDVNVNVSVNASASDDGENIDFIRAGAAAALEGRFRRWARDSGVYEGEAQDRINTYFIEIIGDIILDSFTLIEDYREDVEKWMK